MDWVPFVLEDAREALIQWPQAQDRGMWVAGFFAGASNALPMGGEPEAFICGFSSGSIARANSESKRASTSEVRAAAARARWDRERSKQLEVKCAEYAVEDANACAKADANAMHKTGQDKTRQDTTEQDKTRHPRKSASIPTEDEWVSYCRQTWTDWHVPGESWAYYQSVGWRTKAGPIKDWRAAARISYSKAKEWGKLGQPSNEHDDFWRNFKR